MTRAIEMKRKPSIAGMKLPEDVRRLKIPIHPLEGTGSSLPGSLKMGVSTWASIPTVRWLAMPGGAF
ncbi:MAG TPA: hypothetical protein VEK07_03270 [Polyangiaceae bacterium]|nr:hypothetical protein [Polyangiaceae bacterium]